MTLFSKSRDILSLTHLLDDMDRDPRLGALAAEMRSMAGE